MNIGTNSLLKFLGIKVSNTSSVDYENENLDVFNTDWSKIPQHKKDQWKSNVSRIIDEAMEPYLKKD